MPPLPAIPEQLARISSAHAEAAAIVAPKCALTYGQLFQRVLAIGEVLANRGVGRGSFVAIAAGAEVDKIAGALAANYVGAAFVFLHPPGGAAYTNKRIMEVVRPQVTLVDGADSGADGAEQVVDVRRIGASARVFPPARWLDEECIYAVFTSGSTGYPKGIAISHATLNQYLDWQARTFGFRAAQHLSMWSPFTFDACYGEFYGALLCGARLHVPSYEQRRSPAYIAQWMADHSIEWYVTVPSFLRLLVGEIARKPRGRWDSLRHVFVTGEALPAALARSVYDLLPGVTLHNGYGPTETILACRYVVPHDCRQDDEIAIGRALDGREILLLDEHLQRTPPGSIGQIAILTAFSANGYLDAPEEAAGRFLRGDVVGADPNLRLYLTGDYGLQLPDGTLLFRGRKDNQLKVQGGRVQLEEVERALLSHRSVKQCGVSSVVVNGGSCALVALIVEQMSSDDDELEQHLRAILPEYAVPRLYLRQSELPLGVNGKIDRARLSRLAAEHFRLR